MATVDFKVTVWERVTIDDDKMNEVIEAIKNGTIQNLNDLFLVLNDDCSCEGILSETIEQMTVEENGNQPTIEVLNSNGELITTNQPT